MRFTFEEWGKIKLALTVAREEYHRLMLDCTPSDKEGSMYQAFSRQIREVDFLLEKLSTSEI